MFGCLHPLQLPRYVEPRGYRGLFGLPLCVPFHVFQSSNIFARTIVSSSLAHQVFHRYQQSGGDEPGAPMCLDLCQAETALWCLGKPLYWNRRPLLTLGIVDLEGVAAESAAASDSPKPAEDANSNAFVHAWLLPVWHPKRLLTNAHVAHAPAAAKFSSAPAIYSGYGSGQFHKTAGTRLRLRFEDAIVERADATVAHTPASQLSVPKQRLHELAREFRQKRLLKVYDT
jgi:hypothetical protein